MFACVNDWYKTQEMCYKIVSGDLFMLKYFLDRYKTQGMCDKAADAFLPPLKFVPDWYVTSMIKKLDDLYQWYQDTCFVSYDTVDN